MSTSVNWETARARIAVERERRRRQAESDSPNLVEIDACRIDAAHFIDTHLIIDDAQGDTGGVMPFKLWDDQREALGHLLNDRLVIFLKARQLGISWLCLAYALWLMLFHPGKVVLLFSQGEVEASEMLRRLKAMYERLPAWMVSSLPNRTRNNASEQGWANGSWCKCMPATQRAGRSFTASLVVMDEAAHQQWGGQLYAALKPTIDAGGQLFVVSSANGSDGFFDKLWKKAAGGVNSFHTIFLPWWSRPGRDQAWYDRQVAESADPELVKQEYPSNAIEAFVSSGRKRFLPSWVANQAGFARDSIAASLLPDSLKHLSGFRAYELPDLGKYNQSARKLILSVDVAEGLEHGDYSGGPLVDGDSCEEVACIHGRWEPDEFAVKLAAIADAYDSKILVERNNHGHAVLSKLRTLCRHRILDGHDEREGWLTSSMIKPIAVDALAVGLRDGFVQVRTLAAIQEMQDYSVLSNGKTSAPPGDHDDLVMAWANFMGWRQMVGWKAAAEVGVGGQRSGLPLLQRGPVAQSVPPSPNRPIFTQPGRPAQPGQRPTLPPTMPPMSPPPGHPGFPTGRR